MAKELQSDDLVLGRGKRRITGDDQSEFLRSSFKMSFPFQIKTFGMLMCLFLCLLFGMCMDVWADSEKKEEFIYATFLTCQPEKEFFEMRPVIIAQKELHNRVDKEAQLVKQHPNGVFLNGEFKSTSSHQQKCHIGDVHVEVSVDYSKPDTYTMTQKDHPELYALCCKSNTRFSATYLSNSTGEIIIHKDHQLVAAISNDLRMKDQHAAVVSLNKNTLSVQLFPFSKEIRYPLRKEMYERSKDQAFDVEKLWDKPLILKMESGVTY